MFQLKVMESMFYDTVVKVVGAAGRDAAMMEIISEGGDSPMVLIATT
jgi:hypothetical protein